jgi:EAL domain-containing protein (putative c-di-GMP-specific phosphodiesterase class I)
MGAVPEVRPPQLPGEPGALYELFCLWSSLPEGERTPGELLRRARKDRRLPRLGEEDIARIARRYRWEDRLRAAVAEDDMNERHADLARFLQDRGLDRIRTVPLEEIPVTEATRMVLEGARLERLARGSPDQKIEVQVTADVQKVLDELRRLVTGGETTVEADVRVVE